MKRLVKLMSIALCLLMVLSAALAGVFALSMNGVSLASLADSNSGADKEADTDAPLYKDESVYVIAGADGTVEKIIVSDWIRNNDHRDTITDFANLENIENVKGDETFTLDENNMRVWNANGKDLYIKGESKEALPVDVKLTYCLDGSVIDPHDLVGKSGEVTIRFDYTNNQYETVEIDGEQEKIYVPFLMMSGMILDGSKFTDVSVTNGKILSDGSRSIVAGVAFPGLQQSLGIKKSDIQIPSYFEVKAHVEDFELSTTVTIATNGIFNKLDTKDFDKLDDLKKDMKKLEDAMTQLTDGSSQLYDGLATLLEKSSELTDGIDQLYDGAAQLSDGASELDDGAGQLSDGASQLSDGVIQLSDGTVKLDMGAVQLSGGLSTLTENNDALTQGSDLTFSSILATAQKALTDQGIDVPTLTPQNYAKVLEGLMDNLSEENVRKQAEAVAREKVTAAVEARRETVEAAVTAQVQQNVQAQAEAGVRAQVTQAVLESLGYTVDAYNAAVDAGLVDETTQAQVNGAIDAQMASEQVQATIDNLVEQNMQSDAVQQAIAQNTEAQINTVIEQQMQGEEVQKGIGDAVAKAKAGVQSIKQLKEQLDAYNQFNSGLKAYTSGVESASDGASQLSSGASQLSSGASQLKTGSSELADGAKELKSGTSQLADGAKELLDGILTLKNGVPTLVSGVTQLKDGSMQLSDGLKQFNEEGIEKLVKLMDNDLGKLAARFKAIVDVSKHYKSFTGLTDDMDGEVKFIYKTADLSKNDE